MYARHLAIAVAAFALIGCATPMPLGGGAGMSPAISTAAPTGDLAVQVAGWDRFRLMYAASDIATLKFTVWDPSRGLPAHVTHTQSYSAAVVRSQAGVVTIANLEAGIPQAVSLEAFDGSGTLIGKAGSDGFVLEQGRTTKIMIGLVLMDTPAPAPNVGSVQLGVSIKDGRTLEAPTPATSFGSYQQAAAASPGPAFVTVSRAAIQTQAITLKIGQDLYLVNEGASAPYQAEGARQAYIEAGELPAGASRHLAYDAAGTYQVKVYYYQNQVTTTHTLTVTVTP